MPIVIKTEKTLGNNWEHHQRIIKIKVLPHPELPHIYLNSKKRPIVYTIPGTPNSIFCVNRTDLNCLKYYKVGCNYTSTSISALIQHCKNAGKHLRDCNKKTAKMKKEWTGITTYTI